jgi:hypothetical protein
LEIDPRNGAVIKRFAQPQDWKWDPGREKAHWEEYDGKVFLVFMYEGRMIFQEGKNRFALDATYTSKMKRRGFKWILFQLFKDRKKVYEFKYQDPQTRKKSLLRAFVFDDDWWDWNSPFEDVHKYIEKTVKESFNQTG